MGDDLIVYTRPGCGYCMRLERALTASGIAYVTVDVWDDHEASRFVRSVNNGHETVPTVVLGDEVLSNPHPDEVIARMTGGG
jgi:glutaredoxin-like protein